MLQSMRSAAKYIWLIVAVLFVGIFVFTETSGLSSRGQSTPGSAVASVNGEKITLDMWQRALTNRLAEAQRQTGSLNGDEEQRLKDDLFESMVNEILLQQEYERRRIKATDDEVIAASLSYPHPELMKDPTFQTEGQFDPQKYERFLKSPSAQQQGIRVFLEQYFRAEIPKQKLFEEIASTVYVTDNQLWRIWQDTHDSVQVSYVAFDPVEIPDSAVSVSEKEIGSYYEAHRKDYADNPGRAVVSVTMIPRPITAADSTAVLVRAHQLRSEILAGASFADVAGLESDDSVSAAQGGSLGRTTPGRFVPEFDKVAFALEPGDVSQPVLSPFGYHIIKVDERKADTIAVRHILLRIQQSDSSASIAGQRADTLARIAESSGKPAAFDSMAKALQLPVGRVEAIEGEPVSWAGRYVPGAAAWAFSGVKPGETSGLIDSEEAYYLLRLNSLVPGGQAPLPAVRDEIRRTISREKKIKMLEDRARTVAAAVAAGATLEQAAQSEGVKVDTTPMFNRIMPVEGLGRLNEAVGTAFGLPVDAVSAPVSTREGVFVLRVDRRVNADRAAWEAQKAGQRETVLRALRQQRVQEFVSGLRESAKIDDNRKALEQVAREVTG